MEENLNKVNKALKAVAEGWDVKEFQVNVNETELYVSIKATKKKV